MSASRPHIRTPLALVMLAQTRTKPKLIWTITTRRVLFPPIPNLNGSLEAITEVADDRTAPRTGHQGHVLDQGLLGPDLIPIEVTQMNPGTVMSHAPLVVLLGVILAVDLAIDTTTEDLHQDAAVVTAIVAAQVLAGHEAGLTHAHGVTLDQFLAPVPGEENPEVRDTN